jgi:hypothetical protein
MVVTPEQSAASICCGQMAVEAAGGQYLAFTRDRLGRGADNDVDSGLRVGIAGLTDA